MSIFKKQCIKLRKCGLSLGKISKKTKRPKTSVYFHIKNIPLSKKKLEEIKQSTIKRLVQSSLKRKGKSALNRIFKPFNCWKPPTVSVVAHLLFDGQIRYSSCIYHNRSNSLINQFKIKMRNLYRYQPKEYVNSKTGVKRIDYNNVALATYIKNKSVLLLKDIHSLNKNLQREFLKAFFDDEGSVYMRNRAKAVRGYQYSSPILHLIKRLLTNFGIQSQVIKKYNEIIITRKENIVRFAKEINFSRGLCVNGKRPNSIWKKSLEKREILRRAIASYLKK